MFSSCLTIVCSFIFNLFFASCNWSHQIFQNSFAGSDSCSEGSVTMVSDVYGSSLQLVEMCSNEGVWSPVCDTHWTLEDATAVCKDVDFNGIMNN